MKTFVRFIPFICETAGDFDRRRDLVNSIEAIGFQCHFVSGGVEVWAIKHSSLIDSFKDVIRCVLNV